MFDKQYRTYVSQILYSISRPMKIGELNSYSSIYFFLSLTSDSLQYLFLSLACIHQLYLVDVAPSATSLSPSAYPPFSSPSPSFPRSELSILTCAEWTPSTQLLSNHRRASPGMADFISQQDSHCLNFQRVPKVS